jgi:4-hydroxy-2-oxoheptanedioate aldolase
VFLGPHDLSVSLEAPEQWDNPALHRVIEDIIVRCRAANIGVGVHLSPAIFTLDQVRRLVALGMNWILDGADVTLAQGELKQRRRVLCGEPETAPDCGDIEISSCILPTGASDGRNVS